MAYVTEPPKVCRRGPGICEGRTFALRRRNKDNGTLYLYAYQCLNCGAEGGTVKATEVARQGLKPELWDDSIFARWNAQRQEAYTQKRDDEKSEWFRRYNEYLKTPAWQERRRKVLARAKGVCEGCGERPPVQVHHKTYEHVGDEFLWELAAVCMPCHERAHKDKT